MALAGHVRGATVIVRASEIPEDAHCAALKEVKSFRMAMGENEGKSFFRERIVMKSPEAAAQIKTIAEGFKAMGSLRYSGDAEMMKLVKGASCTVRGSTVNVRWEAPVEDVWTAVQKMAKKFEAHINKMKEMHEDKEKHKDKEKDKDKDDVRAQNISNHCSGATELSPRFVFWAGVA